MVFTIIIAVTMCQALYQLLYPGPHQVPQKRSNGDDLLGLGAEKLSLTGQRKGGWILARIRKPSESWVFSFHQVTGKHNTAI